MRKLKVAEACLIKYTKADGEVTERTIIPTSIPTNLRAIDVTGLSEDETTKISGQMVQYKKYIADHMKTAFSFENYVSQTENETVEVKWRTFKPSGVEILSE